MKTTIRPELRKDEYEIDTVDVVDTIFITYSVAHKRYQNMKKKQVGFDVSARGFINFKSAQNWFPFFQAFGKTCSSFAFGSSRMICSNLMALKLLANSRIAVPVCRQFWCALFSFQIDH